MQVQILQDQGGGREGPATPQRPGAAAGRPERRQRRQVGQEPEDAKEDVVPQVVRGGQERSGPGVVVEGPDPGPDPGIRPPPRSCSSRPLLPRELKLLAWPAQPVDQAERLPREVEGLDGPAIRVGDCAPEGVGVRRASSTPPAQPHHRGAVVGRVERPVHVEEGTHAHAGAQRGKRPGAELEGGRLFGGRAAGGGGGGRRGGSASDGAGAHHLGFLWVRGWLAGFKYE